MNIRSCLIAIAYVVAPATAEAGHCRAFATSFGEVKALRAKADRAEAAGDMETACALRGKVVRLEERMLRETKNDCFHGQKSKFEFMLTASRAVEDMSCNPDDGLFDDE